jgi:RNA polymerase sigma-70 factor (ECF subfamily)
LRRNDHKKKEKVAVVADQIKGEDIFEEWDDAQLFKLKSKKLAKTMTLIDGKDKMIHLMKYEEDTAIVEIKGVLK